MTELEAIELELIDRELAQRQQPTMSQETGVISTPQTFQREQLERTIAQRPDIYKQASQEMQYAPQIAQQHPFQIPALPLDIALKSLGGVAQRAEAAIANPFLEMGAGRGTVANLPYRMLRGVKQGIMGERLGELGDIARQVGIPEPISAGLGLVGTGILGGAVARWAGLGQKANNLTKLQTTYGKDIAKNIIKQGSGLTDEAVEYGMNKGWKNILTKENALNPQKGYNLVLRVKKGLQGFYRNLNKSYGEKLDDIASKTEMNIPTDNIRLSLKNTLQNVGVLDIEGKTIRTPINKVEKEVLRLHNELANIKEEISLKQIVQLKNRLWNSVRKTALEGNQPINSGERIVYDLQDKIGQAMNFATEYLPSDKDIMTLQQLNAWYAPKRQMFNVANTIFKVFKNDYSTKTGESIFNRYFNLDIGTKQLLQDLDTTLPTKFLDELKTWKIAQDFLIQPSSQGLSLYPFRLIAESGKYGLRQSLKSGIPTMVGKTGNLMNRVNPYIVPPSILRFITGRNKEVNNVSE